MKSQTKKLQLNKETVAKLNDESMAQIKGGAIAGKFSIYCTNPDIKTRSNCTYDYTFDCKA